MAGGESQTGAQTGARRSGGFVQKIFAQNGGDAGGPRKKGRGAVAQVPSTVLTVEYVDGSEGIEATIRALNDRLVRIEKLLLSMQETNTELVPVINRQAKEMGQFVQSLNRRVDHVYRVVSGPGAPAAAASGAVKPTQIETVEFAVPAAFADDSAHQQAWRVARVMAGDLDAYYSDLVREGVVYDNFSELLAEPIQQARQTYQERVPAEVTEKVDYLELALKELIAAKRQALADEEPAEAQ